MRSKPIFNKLVTFHSDSSITQTVIANSGSTDTAELTMLWGTQDTFLYSGDTHACTVYATRLNDPEEEWIVGTLMCDNSDIVIDGSTVFVPAGVGVYEGTFTFIPSSSEFMSCTANFRYEVKRRKIT